MKTAIISLSGGMDSTCLLMRLFAKGYKVYGISFDYGQNHRVELDKLKQNLEYLKSNGYELKEYRLIDLKSIGSMFHSGLLSGDIPEGHYEQENMKQTVVPNRNAIFSAITYGWALSIAKKIDSNVKIALGVHSGDHAIYPDCRPEFYIALNEAFTLGNWDSDKVEFYLPYLHGDKTTILQDCLYNCDKLSLNFDTVLKNTNTSYNPDNEGRASGTSGADIERIEAFINIDRQDPVEYILPWEEVKAHALNLLQ